jgi:hypothetical protein
MGVGSFKCALLAACAAAAACTGEIATDPASDGANPATGGALPVAGDRDPGTAGVDGAGAGASASDPGAPAACSGSAIAPGRAPLRRLTRFEYNNTVRDLLGDTTSPADAFASEELGNGFGNEADAQSVSSLLAEQYSAASEAIAARATGTPTRLAALASCAADVTAATVAEDEQACVRTLIADLLPRAFRRPLAAAEVDEFLALQQAIRAEVDFATSIATVIEAVLQSPEFLYRVEEGGADPARADVRRPSGHEMATRLSYLFWGTMPDAALRAAADAGELQTADGVLAQATRLLDDERARAMLRFFFDNLLPISSLSALERDGALFPSFTPAIGALMREETHSFLEYEIFEGPGSWQSALTAPYTFLNEELARFYGVDGVQGEAFQKVALDTDRRLGLLTQPGVLAGTTHSNTTSPVVRGAYVVRKLMCTEIPLPTAELLGDEVFEMIKPPEPYSGDTARERYGAHSDNPVCASCHRSMDPVGLALENYDALGQWRDQENGVTIDASGSVPGVPGEVSGPIELVQKIASAEQTQACFVSHWLNFAYGRTLGGDDDCLRRSVQAAFTESGHDVRELLLSLTQTDAFLYLPAREE